MPDHGPGRHDMIVRFIRSIDLLSIPRFARLALLALLPAGVLLWQLPALGEKHVAIPVPAIDEPIPAASGSETTIFAGGCFWGVQGVFQHVRGVTSAVSGY